jgi:hypothetical protein
MSDNAAGEYGGGRTTPAKKGRPGKSSGRPKRAARLLDPASILEEIDNEEIVVVDNGKRKRMTKAEVEIRQLFANATKGDLKSARLILNLATDSLVPASPAIEKDGPKGQQYGCRGPISFAKLRTNRLWLSVAAEKSR